MQILPTIMMTAVAMTAIPHATQLSSRSSRSESVLVTAVFDGDTIRVTTYGRVRLLGIDAPEVGRGFDSAAPFGREARDRLTALVLHRWVRLEQDGPTLDAYNRRLAYVIRDDGVHVNAELVREGLARISARLPLTRLDELKRAEAEARTFRRGMWGAMPSIPPASYTRPAGAKRSATGTSRTKQKHRKKISGVRLG
jgi:endonuclease YncB( thermonuclease family)